ncbi:MAG: hypothetical protein ACK5Q5_17945 [Planctomycetaceae bacterium]
MTSLRPDLRLESTSTNADTSLRRETKSIWFNASRRIALLLLALWWGGLTFYAVVVIPIGTELLGSVEQGFITQRVTLWLNRLALLTAIATASAVFRSGRRSRYLNWTVLTIGCPVLMLLHSRLDAGLDLAAREVIDSDSFYREHQYYLWATTLQWLAGGSLLWGLTGKSLPQPMQGGSEKKRFVGANSR